MGTLEQMAARHIVDVKVLGSSPRRPPIVQDTKRRVMLNGDSVCPLSSSCPYGHVVQPHCSPHILDLWRSWYGARD